MDEKQVEKLIADLRQNCWRIDKMAEYLPPFSVKDAIIRRSKFWYMECKQVKEEMRTDNYRRNMYLNVCLGCIHRFECTLISYTHRAQKNVIINYFGNGEKEIIVMKQPLNCIDEFVNVDIDHTRNYVDLLGDGCLYPKDENLANSRFLENMDNSARQSRDAFWGYALSNHWDYFITLTTDKLKVNRYDDEAVKRLWRICRQRIQRFDKDAKILLVPERHKDGALHFHGLVAMSKRIRSEQFRIKGKPKYSDTGAPLFEFPFWDFGFASYAIIYDNDELLFWEKNLPKVKVDAGQKATTSQRRVVAYLNKYMDKQFGNIGYGCKSFYKTKNVTAKIKVVEFWDEKSVFENTRLDPTLYEYKDDDKRTIFRTRFVGYDDKKQ